MTFIKLNTLFSIADEKELSLLEMELLSEEDLEVEAGEEWINSDCIVRFHEADLPEDIKGVTIYFTDGEAKTYEVTVQELLGMLNLYQAKLNN